MKTARAGRLHAAVAHGICFERQLREAFDPTEKARGRRQPHIRVQACGTFSSEDTQWPLCPWDPAATPPCPPATQHLSAGAADPPPGTMPCLHLCRGDPCRVLTPPLHRCLACRVLPVNPLPPVGLPPHPGLREARWVLKGPPQRLCTHCCSPCQGPWEVLT